MMIIIFICQVFVLPAVCICHTACLPVCCCALPIEMRRAKTQLKGKKQTNFSNIQSGASLETFFFFFESDFYLICFPDSIFCVCSVDFLFAFCVRFSLGLVHWKRKRQYTEEAAAASLSFAWLPAFAQHTFTEHFALRAHTSANSCHLAWITLADSHWLAGWLHYLQLATSCPVNFCSQMERWQPSVLSLSLSPGSGDKCVRWCALHRQTEKAARAGAETAAFVKWFPCCPMIRGAHLNIYGCSTVLHCC